MASFGENRIRIAMGGDRDRAAIYRMRHDVYAAELGQHAPNRSGTLSDPLDDFNVYLTAKLGGDLVGFVSITPPGFGRYSVDKYLARDELPFPNDNGLYEIRILTVAKPHRQGRVAPMLMYGAFRWLQEQGCEHVVAIGRVEVKSIYEKLGLRPLGRAITAGDVSFELMGCRLNQIRSVVGTKRRALERLRGEIRWDLPVPYFEPTSCYHGGAFFDAIGPDFTTLEKRAEIVNADVLDAWFEPSPLVTQALSAHLPWLIRTSPPTDCGGMRQAIAEARGVKPENILPGAGSSDLIFLALRHWLTAGSWVLILDPAYGEYAHILERVIGCRVDRLGLRRSEGYAVNPERLAAALGRGYDLVVLVNPNSPTGRHIRQRDLEPLLAAAPAETRFWIDETYVEYAGDGESLESVAAASRNISVCKSMSKVYALSGARAAYLCAHSRQIAELAAITPPWAVSLPGQVAAVKALSDPDYYRQRYAETHALREELVRGLKGIGIDEVVPGIANFVMLHLAPRHPTAARVVEACRNRGVYLRDISTMGSRLGDRALRIAVKDAATNRTVLETLAEVLNGG